MCHQPRYSAAITFITPHSSRSWRRPPPEDPIAAVVPISEACPACPTTDGPHAAKRWVAYPATASLRRLGVIRRVLVWLSTADPDLLRLCPAERVRYECIGAAVLITSMLSAISAAFALVAAGPRWAT